MKVGDLMIRRVHSCAPTDSLASVMQILWERDLGALPVVNEAGQPIAMITDRDVAVAAYTQGRPLPEIPVQTAMSQRVHAAHVSDALTAAERTMRVHQLRRLPVVDESSRLVGIVTASDLVRLRAQPDAAPTHVGDIVQTLAAVARPRFEQEGAQALHRDEASDDSAPPSLASDVRALAHPAEKPASATGSARRRAKR